MREYMGKTERPPKKAEEIRLRLENPVTYSLA